MKGTYLESCLADYFLIAIHAEYELEIKNIVSKKTDESKDVTVANYAKNYIDVRSLNISALKGNILNKFDAKYGEAFSIKLCEKKQEIEEYNSIITNRNSVAHGNKSNMSFDEIVRANLSAQAILGCFKEALNIY